MHRPAPIKESSFPKFVLPGIEPRLSRPALIVQTDRWGTEVVKIGRAIYHNRLFKLLIQNRTHNFYYPIETQQTTLADIHRPK